MEQAFRSNEYVKLLGSALFRSILRLEILRRSLLDVGFVQRVPREMSVRRGLIKDEASIIGCMEFDELGNEDGLKWEAMDKDLRMDLGEGGGASEQGE